MKRFLTKKEVGEYLGVSVRKIDYMRNSGLPCFVDGGTVRFRLEDIDKWVESRMSTEGVPCLAKAKEGAEM